MTNEQLAKLLRGYAREFRREIDSVRKNLSGDFRVENEIVDGSMRYREVTYPVLDGLADALEILESDITDLECADD